LRTKLTRADTGKALAHKQVLIYHRATPSASWKRIRKLRTDVAGRADLTLQPKRSGQLEAVFPGTRGIARSAASTKYVVRPVVTAVLSSDTAVHGGTVTLSGGVTPAVSNAKVTRQRLMNGAWVNRGKTRTNRRGLYTFDLQPNYAGTYILRVVVAPADGRGETHSHRVRLTVS
jgi:hypothetical protein